MAVTALPPNALLLEGLSSEQKDVLAAAARSISLTEGERLFQLGDEAKDLFVVRSGVVELTLQVPVSGASRRVVVEETSAGETIGWSALVPPHQYTLDAFAAVDSDLLAFGREELLGVCKAHPELGTELLQNLLLTVGRRLHVLHAMWVRELRRSLERDYPKTDGS